MATCNKKLLSILSYRCLDLALCTDLFTLKLIEYLKHKLESNGVLFLHRYIFIICEKHEENYGMVVFDGNTHLDYLYQKSLRYQHHRENYLTSMFEGWIPSHLD